MSSMMFRKLRLSWNNKRSDDFSNNTTSNRLHLSSSSETERREKIFPNQTVPEEQFDKVNSTDLDISVSSQSRRKDDFIFKKLRNHWRNFSSRNKQLNGGECQQSEIDNSPIMPNSKLVSNGTINNNQMTPIASPIDKRDIQFIDDTTEDFEGAGNGLDILDTSQRLPALSGSPFNQSIGLAEELLRLSKCGWYWGPITRAEAENKLKNQPEGAFLVRDSTDERYIFSLSFNCYEQTLHTRIEYRNGRFSFYAQEETGSYSSVADLIESSMCNSLSGVFCYLRCRHTDVPTYPVQLTIPVSRFTHVRSLQYLCRFVIRQHIRLDHIEKLPLPAQIKDYVQEGAYTGGD